MHQPAVHEQVERIVRRLDLNGAERALPERVDFLRRRFDGRQIAAAAEQRSGLFDRVAFAEQEDELARLTGRQRHAHVQGAARVETGAEAIRQHARGHCSGARERAVAADELGPVAGHRPHGFAGPGEGDAVGKPRVVRIVRDERPGGRVATGDHMPLVPHPRRAEQPFVVAVDAERPGSPGRVGQRQPRRLHRFGWKHEDLELLVQLPCGPFEARDAGAMAYHPRGLWRSRQRTRRGAPHLAAFLVSEKDRLRRRVGDRVVRKRRQPVLATVARPGEGGARGRDDGAELAIGQHVGPRRRRVDVAGQHDGVLAAPAGEPADAIRHRQ